MLHNQQNPAPILIVTAVESEREAVLRGLNGDSRFEVIAGGVGSAAAAASTAAVLARGGKQLVISAGIAGGFSDRAGMGTIVIASDIIAADFGAETADGFLTVDELGFGSSRISSDPMRTSLWAERIAKSGLTVHTGPVITVNTATGSAETAAQLAARIPGAAAEAMEGYGVAVAAKHFALPILELRTISNPVGPRDRDAWRIGDALNALASAFTVLQEVIELENSLLPLSK